MNDLDRWRAQRKPDPKPRRRIRKDGVGIGVVRAWKQCWVCGKPTLVLEAHHLVPRSQGGDDVEENYAPLCGPWEPSCHRKVTEGDPTAVRALRRALPDYCVEYIVERKGSAWLDLRYPR